MSNANGNCVFCKIVAREIPAYVVYEDEDTLAFLDAKPINPGHTLVIPKEHHANIYEIPQELLKKVIATVQKVAVAVKNGVDSDGLNVGLNNDSAAGQEVYHLHFHVMPRHEGDGYELWHGDIEQSDEEKKETVERIRGGL